MSAGKKIILTAICAEFLLVGTGLSLAGVQGMLAYTKHGQLSFALSAAAFPFLLAALELFKIPAGWSLYHARWIMKPFAVLLLAGGMVATFETVTMAGSTWFRSLQFEVTSEQAELEALRSRRNAGAEDIQQSAQIVDAIERLDRQIESVADAPETAAARQRIDALTADLEELRGRRLEARSLFASEWDTQTANNTTRINSGNPDVAEQGLASQRSMPTRQAYIDARMSEWNEAEGGAVRDRIAELEIALEAARNEAHEAQQGAASETQAVLATLRNERSELQARLAAALQDERSRQTDRIAMDEEIERQRLLVAKLANESLIYDIAAKAFGVRVDEVTERQANVVTYWVVLGVGLATSVATGLAAFVAAHIDSTKRSPDHVRALREVNALRQALSGRDRTVAELRRKLAEKPPIEYRDRVVYRYLPIDRDLGEAGTVVGLAALQKDAADAA